MNTPSQRDASDHKWSAPLYSGFTCIKLTAFSLAVALSVSSGCVSSHVIHEAKQNSEPSATPSADGGDALEPATHTRFEYYLLLPLTVPIDIVTFPIQAFVMWRVSKVNGTN